MVFQKGDNTSDTVAMTTDTWNVADSFVKIKLFKPMWDCDRYEIISLYGTENPEEIIPPEMITQRRIDAIHRLKDTIKLIFSNANFIIRKADRNNFTSMRKHLKTMYYKPLINNTIKSKLKIESPMVCLSILNYMFQLKGSLRYMKNIMMGGDYNHQCKIINHFSCPTLDFFYCTLVLLNSINHEGDMDIRCANVVKETIRLSEKSTDKLSDTWDDTRIIYLASLYYLPYMY